MLSPEGEALLGRRQSADQQRSQPPAAAPARSADDSDNMRSSTVTDSVILTNSVVIDQRSMDRREQPIDGSRQTEPLAGSRQAATVGSGYVVSQKSSTMASQVNSCSVTTKTSTTAVRAAAVIDSSASSESVPAPPRRTSSKDDFCPETSTSSTSVQSAKKDELCQETSLGSTLVKEDASSWFETTAGILNDNYYYSKDDFSETFWTRTFDLIVDSLVWTCLFGFNSYRDKANPLRDRLMKN